MPSAVSNRLSKLCAGANEAKAAIIPMKYGFIALTVFFSLQVAASPVDEPLLSTPLARVEFSDWRLMEDTGKTSTFAAEFPSAYPSGRVQNDTVHLQVMVPKGVAKPPVVLLLHYWGAPDLRAETAQATRLAKLGIASVMMELPYHLSRTPSGTRSGELAISPDPASLRQMMIQAVGDIRRTVDWIESRPELDASRIGLAGTSLGAVIGSVAFAVEPRLGSYCSVLGGADLAGILWRSARLVRERDVMRRNGLTRESLTKALVTIEPLTHLRQDDLRPIFVIGAKYDTVVPRANQEALAKHLVHSQSLWLPTGHYGGFLVQQSLFREVGDFFSATFQGAVYQPPARLYAPTLRVIGLANPVSGLSVGAGLDVWNLDQEGRVFATVILTPKGLQGFVGTRVSTGFSLGVSILPRKTTLGALWSFVL